MAPSEIRDKVVNVIRLLVDDKYSEMIIMDEPHEHARATLPVHFGAGPFGWFNPRASQPPQATQEALNHLSSSLSQDEFLKVLQECEQGKS